MKIFPESASVQLEFDKVTALLVAHTRTAFAAAKAETLRIHTRRDIIERELSQTQAYQLIIQSGQAFPNDTVLNIRKELQLLGIPGAVLKGEDFVQIRRLADAISQIFRWFNVERQEALPTLFLVISQTLRAAIRLVICW